MNFRDAYPLTWPIGTPRTYAHQRKPARFSSSTGSGARRPITISAAINRVRDVIDMFDASGLVISTNLELRQDGLPRSAQRDPEDPGAAVFFRLKSKPYVVACDRWDRVADNIAAIAAHLEAMRGQDRWGCGSVEQAFAGYKALAAPDADKPWWQTLGFADGPPTVWDAVEEQYRILIRLHHPDRGGDPETMAAINVARDEARKYFAPNK